jgi:hypothetical protein
MEKLNQISRRKMKQEKVQKPEISTEEKVDPDQENLNLLDFDDILKSQGLNLDALLEDSTSTHPPQMFNQDTIMSLLTMGGLADAFSGQSQKENHDTSENEAAPMSALVDEYKSEEDIRKERQQESHRKEEAFKRSVLEASSASEDERGFKHRKCNGLASDEELIDTTASHKGRSMLSGQAIKQPSTNSNGVTMHSSGGGEGLIIQLPGMNLPKTKNKEEQKGKAERPISAGMGPESMLFKRSENLPNTIENDSNLVESSEQDTRPQTANQKIKKINYRGVWIESKNSSDEEDTTEADRHYFNTQRELMKQRLKKAKNTEFGDIDSLKMENVGVEMVGDEKLVKVDRDWGDN